MVLGEHGIPLPFSETPAPSVAPVEQPRLLLQVQSALLGAVSPCLRAVACGLQGETIKLRFIFDGSVSEEDEANVREVANAVAANYSAPVTVCQEIVRADYPAILAEYSLRKWAYIRKEH